MLEVNALLRGRYRVMKVTKTSEQCTVYLVLSEKANKIFAATEIPENTVAHLKIAAVKEIICRLDHPNLIRIVDIIQIETSIVLIHDYFQGESMEVFFSKAGNLTHEKAVLLIKQICDALEYLHLKTDGVFCGKISPSMILVNSEYNIVLTDFYLCSESEIKSSRDTTCLGTKYFSAPEQYGKTVSADVRTDIYRVGAMLSILLSGNSDNEQISEIKTDRDLGAVGLPQLKRVIEMCMQRSPEDRYQSFAELMYDLESRDSNCIIRKKRAEIPRLIKSWFRSRSTLSGTKKKLSGITDIRFSALAPKKFIKGEYTIVEIAMYEDEYKHIAIQSRLKDTTSETTTGYFQIADKTEVSIYLSSPDVQIEDNVRTLVWCGKYLIFQFAVYLPEDFSKKQLLFNAAIYFDNIIATKITFVARCSSIREQKMKVFRNDILSAFISYASQDRNRVALIIQGMRKSRPDMDIFFDVDALRSGEKWEQRLIKEIEDRDVLFLCWSRFAKESKWVETEWKYALSKKGIDSIEPIPLEPPMNCPPPKELESKHFNDRELFYCNM